MAVSRGAGGRGRRARRGAGRGPTGREVDLEGRLVTPAFVDAHVHAVQTGLVVAGLDLHDVGSVDELLERVRRYADRTRAAA